MAVYLMLINRTLKFFSLLEKSSESNTPALATATAASDIFNQDLEDYTPPEIAEAVRTGTVPPQPSIPTVVRQSQPAAGTSNNRVITKGQLEILWRSQRRSRISEAEFNHHVLETYQIAELKELNQKDVNALLEWLETQQENRLEALERQAIAMEN